MADGGGEEDGGVRCVGARWVESPSVSVGGGDVSKGYGAAVAEGGVSCLPGGDATGGAGESEGDVCWGGEGGDGGGEEGTEGVEGGETNADALWVLVSPQMFEYIYDRASIWGSMFDGRVWEEGIPS